MNNYKILIIVTIIVLAIILLSLFNFNIPDIINTNFDKIINYTKSNPINAKILFFVIYIFLTSFSIPIAFILGLLSGMLFEIVDAVVIVSFASSIGAVIAFTLSRYLFRNYFQKTFLDAYIKIDQGFKRNGAHYLYAIRMSPIFPYFIVNLAFGLTTMRTYIFYLVSQIGMLPMTIIVILTGKEMLNILTTNVGFNQNIIILLTLIGILPLLFKFIMRRYL
jgi:uncharacterized membrane protein YdjX (TVP38/TMEM64 family)